jgi:hypothetical protein
VVGFGVIRCGSGELRPPVGEIVGVYGQVLIEGDLAEGLAAVCPPLRETPPESAYCTHIFRACSARSRPPFHLRAIHLEYFRIDAATAASSAISVPPISAASIRSQDVCIFNRFMCSSWHPGRCRAPG